METLVSVDEIARARNGPTEGQTVFSDNIRRAIAASPRTGLADLATALWRSFAAGAIPEEEAQQLAEFIEARKVVPSRVVNLATRPRRVGSRPRASASLERRRSWAAAGWLPPNLAAKFTPGEAAAMSIVVAEVAQHGECVLHVGAIAARAGVSESTVRNARRQAERLGLLHVEQRRVAYAKSLPNRITVTSKELTLWMRTRVRVAPESIGCKLVLASTSLHIPNAARPAETARKMGSRGETWSTTKRSASPVHHPRSETCEGRASWASM